MLQKKNTFTSLSACCHLYLSSTYVWSTRRSDVFFGYNCRYFTIFFNFNFVAVKRNKIYISYKFMRVVSFTKIHPKLWNPFGCSPARIWSRIFMYSTSNLLHLLSHKKLPSRCRFCYWIGCRIVFIKGFGFRAGAFRSSCTYHYPSLGSAKL